MFATSLTPGANGISTDLATDFIGKLVFESGWGHYELKAIGRSFRARFEDQNRTAIGGGVGMAAILPVSVDLDLLVEGLAGRGIDRYAAVVGPDAAIGPDGSVHPTRAVQAITGFDWKPTSSLQVYNYFGLEHYGRTSFPDSQVGYGSPRMNLASCVADVGFPCPSGNRSIWQIMPGIWPSFAQGDQGSCPISIPVVLSGRGWTVCAHEVGKTRS